MIPKTHAVKASEIEHRWWVVDATGVPLGRLASRVAMILRGKHKAMYSPHLDVGDYVVIVNADKVALTGNKMNQKLYRHHSGYPGGFKEIPFERMFQRHPTRIVEQAVKGMLPKTALGNQMLKKLKIYTGPNHPHAAQQVEALPPTLGR